MQSNNSFIAENIIIRKNWMNEEEGLDLTTSINPFIIELLRLFEAKNEREALYQWMMFVTYPPATSDPIWPLSPDMFQGK